MKTVRFIGLDVHAQSIAVAVAEPDGEVRSLGSIPNDPAALSKLMRKLGKPAQLRVCYEAGPTGYVLYWQLTKLDIKCEVVAPTLMPIKQVIGSRPIAAMLSDWQEAIVAETLRQCGSQTQLMKHCATWSELVRRPSATHCARDIGWENFCCARGGVLRKD